MDGGSSEGSEGRFAAYVEELGTALGHADRQQPMRDYCLGLLMVSGGRPSCFDATSGINRSRRKHSRSTYRAGPGKTLPGARALQTGCHRASPDSACGRHRDTELSEPRAEEWLLIEWPQGEAEPTKYWFATLPEEISFEGLVDFAKLRWRIERDYQELKQELGLCDYEGRGWRGFHHHATLCIAAYGFLIAERSALPPSAPGFSTQLSRFVVPKGYRPRGTADSTRAAHSQLDHHSVKAIDRRPHQDPAEMPLLQYADP